MHSLARSTFAYTNRPQHHDNIDPKVSAIVTKELAKESVVVFDEAHNIDSICIEALSVYLDKRRLKMAANNIKMLKSRVSEMKEADAQKLQQEYNRLVQGLANDNSAVGRQTMQMGAGLVVEVACRSTITRIAKSGSTWICPVAKRACIGSGSCKYSPR